MPDDIELEDDGKLLITLDRLGAAIDYATAISVLETDEQKAQYVASIVPWRPRPTSQIDCVVNIEVDDKYNLGFMVEKFQLIPGVKIMLPDMDADPEEIRRRIKNPFQNPGDPLLMKLTDPLFLRDLERQQE